MIPVSLKIHFEFVESQQMTRVKMNFEKKKKKIMNSVKDKLVDEELLEEEDPFS